MQTLSNNGLRAIDLRCFYLLSYYIMYGRVCRAGGVENYMKMPQYEAIKCCIYPLFPGWET